MDKLNSSFLPNSALVCEANITCVTDKLVCSTVLNFSSFMRHTWILVYSFAFEPLVLLEQNFPAVC